MRYFTRPNPGASLPRYFVMHPTRNAFVRVQVSCPDGEHIREPAGVRDERPTSVHAFTPRFDAKGLKLSAGASTDTRQCKSCTKVLPMTAYRERDRGGHHNWCRTCMGEYDRQRMAKRRAAAKAEEAKRERAARVFA